MLTKFSEKTRVVAGSHARHLPINLTHRTVPRAIFEINNGYGIKIGQTAKASYGYINLLYQNPSFTEQYGIRGGTFVSINNSKGDCIFRIDWDPKDGLHIQ